MCALPFRGPIAQWLEQATHNRLVGGSNPSGPTNIARASQEGEDEGREEEERAADQRDDGCQSVAHGWLRVAARSDQIEARRQHELQTHHRQTDEIQSDRQLARKLAPGLSRARQDDEQRVGTDLRDCRGARERQWLEPGNLCPGSGIDLRANAKPIWIGFC